MFSLLPFCFFFGEGFGGNKIEGPRLDGRTPHLGEAQFGDRICDGVVSVVPGRPSARAAPDWAVDGVAVAARSDPSWAEDCGCAVPDSARRARRRADSRTVTFSMAAVARSVVTKQVLGEKAQDVTCRTSDGGKATTIYRVGVRAKSHGHTRDCQPGLTLNRPPVPR